jgi:hypothetical protein
MSLLLQEDGDKLLQEDGDALLLEQTVIDPRLLLEDGSLLLQEDGDALLLDVALPPSGSTAGVLSVYRRVHLLMEP